MKTEKYKFILLRSRAPQNSLRHMTGRYPTSMSQRRNMREAIQDHGQPATATTFPPAPVRTGQRERNYRAYAAAATTVPRPIKYCIRSRLYAAAYVLLKRVRVPVVFPYTSYMYIYRYNTFYLHTYYKKVVMR